MAKTEEKANKIIRETAKKAGVPLWKIGKAFGMRDVNFCVKLREEFSEEETQKALKIIEELEDNNKGA